MKPRKAGLIAVVASDPDYRASLRDMLVKTGYSVVTLKDAREALDAMEASPPDLVVADLSPAHLEGWALSRLLRSSAHASLNKVPVLIVSAEIQDEKMGRITADLGGDGILPFSLGRERLLAQVVALLEHGVQALPGGGSRQFRSEESYALSKLAADNARREVEEGFAAAFEHFPAAASIATFEDGAFLQVNRQFEDVFGFRREELIGRTSAALGLLPWESRSHLRRLLEQQGRLSGVEVQIRAKGGRIVYCLLNVEVIRMGGHDRVLAMMLDITDRKRMEETIRQSEERLRLALEAANTVVWEIKTADGSLDEIGPVDRQFGSTGSAHANIADVVSSIHPADRDRVLAAVAAAMRGEGELRVEFRVPQPDGGEKWLEGDGTLIRDAEGNPERLMGVGIDVSERKRAEISLREREQELAAAQRIAKIGSWKWDVRTDEASWSEETFRIFGSQPGGLENHRSRFVDMIHPEDRARVDQALTDGLHGTAEYDIQYRIQCPGGQEKLIHSQAEVLRDIDGKPTLMRGTVHDVTEHRQAEAERERLEEQLRQAQKLESIGRLAGGVAHDFNNLLTVINGYSDFLLEQTQEQDPLQGSLVEIRKAGERAAGLTRQLLAFSRKQVIEPRPVNLNELVLEARKMLGRMVQEDIDIVTDLEPESGQVMVDPGQLHQVLLNLVVNARDAMPGGGRLTLRSSRLHLDAAAASSFPGAIPGPYAVLEVSDTGVGMSEDIQQRVFDPFFTTKGPGEGTGLGLSTVYGIVRQAGGWIRVESRPGMGATFRIGLPLLAQPASQAQSAEPRPGQLEGSETVLVVEDQDEVRKLTLSVLKKFGYQTLEARSGSDALLIAEKQAGPIHLMLTDMVMPGMTGKLLAERLRPTRPEMKVVYMSGYTADVITRQGILEPGIEFIEKPFSPGALARKVRTVLGVGGQRASAPE